MWDREGVWCPLAAMEAKARSDGEEEEKGEEGEEGEEGEGEEAAVAVAVAQIQKTELALQKIRETIRELQKKRSRFKSQLLASFAQDLADAVDAYLDQLKGAQTESVS